MSLRVGLTRGVVSVMVVLRSGWSRVAFIRKGAPMMGKAVCVECGRVFDLADEIDAEEWAYGHDCEES